MEIQKQYIIGLAIFMICQIIMIIIVKKYHPLRIRINDLIANKILKKRQFRLIKTKSNDKFNKGNNNPTYDVEVILNTNEHQNKIMEIQNLKHEISQLNQEISTLKIKLEAKEEAEKTLDNAIKIRIEMFNDLMAAQISGNESYSKKYQQWVSKMQKNKNEFMRSNQILFQITHPKFIEYLKSCELTDTEIEYACLYALGLRGKEIGTYIQNKRHYHISSGIRKKLGIDEHQTNINIYIRNLINIQ